MISLILATVVSVKESISTNPEYISYTITAVSSAISAIVTGFGSYILGKRKTASSEFSELVTANTKFRDEIKVELYEAKSTIEKLQKAIEDNKTVMEEMQSAIADLKHQLITKETKISDMEMDIIKKDYQIQSLRNQS